VLLYRFFTDSAATEGQWRILHSLLDSKASQAPTFDPNKHSVTLNELRHLYVAVTRARNRLWIFDTSSRIEPLKVYLKSKALVKLSRPGEELPEMAVSSTPKQWRKTAKSL
jgi:superfamily I DNA/RNA helicase